MLIKDDCTSWLDDDACKDSNSSTVAAEAASATAPASSTNHTTRPRLSPLEMEQCSVAADLGGLYRLSVDAVHLTTKLVEAQHSRLDFFSNYFFPDRGVDRARNPIAALVYNSIYGVNYVVGSILSLGLSAIEPLLGETAPSVRKEAALAILNGVVGDYLVEQHNPLAIPMQWRRLWDHKVSVVPPSHGGRYLLLLHGSCSSPKDWWQEGHNHGLALSAALDYEPLFLHYNTGLHISENGQALAVLIERLVQEHDQIVSLSILAHSMGGLVARSACYYAAQQDNNLTWLEKVEHLIMLGTPHHGALLERSGKLVDAVLGAHRFTEPLSWLGKIRSNGVTDLGYGNVREEDWLGHSGRGDTRKSTPLPASVNCMAIAAVLGGTSSNRLLGESIRTDGLVTEASALGRGDVNSALNLEFEEQITFYNLGHFGLLSSKEVYTNILCYLSG